MTDVEKKKAAIKFANEWKGRGYEKGQSQPFWLALLRNVFGVEQPENYISFEDAVRLDRTSFIDGIISETHVLIEQKSLGKDLKAPIKQSDGTFLTPFQQAKRYASELPYSERPRWIVTCNFDEFLVYDMEKPQGEPEQILLQNLGREYHRLNFLVNPDSDNIKKETAISLQAGEFVKEFYDAVKKQYQDPDSPEALRSLNMLCVRIVFCLYAGSAKVFGKKYQFRDYIKRIADRDINAVRKGLIELFQVLNTEEKDRDKYMDEDLAAFPYVNGGLFDDEDIEIPRFNEKIVNIILKNRDENFDWSEINPTIFGAVFESTLNPATRRSGGMHYTSIVNIHKVIDPLFLDNLKAELEEIKSKKQVNVRLENLKAFQEKLSSLVFLDPACGSGNFLTETYISLRRLENEVLKLCRDDGQIMLDTGAIIKVSIGQFYGFEVNDFAVKVAKTALWIAESQMMKETEDIVNMNLNFLPLKSYANIVECNALRIDWEDVVAKDELSYILGNPPFLGGMIMSRKQKVDMIDIFGDIKGVGELDYVSAWYKKATEYIRNTDIKVAFVSTNSIAQGQQAVTLWKPLAESGIIINFAYRTFVWNNETKGKAAVHCVIIGFSFVSAPQKYIYDETDKSEVTQINSYLVEAPNIFIESRSIPLCNVPSMRFGSMPRDGGGFILSDDEKEELISKEPLAEKWVQPYIGSYELINNKSRWCLWLVDANPVEIRKCPTVMERVESIRKFRANSVAAGTRKFADTPTLFCQIAQPNTDFIIVPSVSSERRNYIPIGFLPCTTIVSNLAFLIPKATLYHFGVLTSNVHNAWLRTVCGRLKSDYRYSKDIVYNNFAWIDVSDVQKNDIEKLSQTILNIREKFFSKGNSLADLYDPNYMPPELLKAHKALDKAVMKLYGFSGLDEAGIVSGLMEKYKKLRSGGAEK